MGRGSREPPPVGPLHHCCYRTQERAGVSRAPSPAFPYPSGRLPCTAVSVEGDATTSALLTATSQLPTMRLERVFSVNERLVRLWTRLELGRRRTRRRQAPPTSPD